ncbi:MAG TPA: SURF1 family protein [Candidatus Limnocylindrales bacterium]
MLRLFLTRRWLGLLCLTLLASAIMVFLGRWQWGRYELRSDINARIEASATAQPVPFSAGAREWTRVTMTGEYDPELEILIRNRTVEGRNGFEILTPLRLADGTAVLVDRGWVAPHPSGAVAKPEVPPAPGGTVSVVGRVRAPESGATRIELRDGQWQARRVGVAEIAPKLPYKVAPVYVTADDESTELVPISAGRENDWLNLGYAVQWWLFAGGALFAYFWLLRREYRQPAPASASSSRLLDGELDGERHVPQEQRLG